MYEYINKYYGVIFMSMDRKNVKKVTIYINDSQKSNLQKFLNKINFYSYSIQPKLEGSWEHGIRHLNNHVWPGSESVFYLIIAGDKVDKLLKKLKSFRMTLPENVVMAILVDSLDDFIYNMYSVDITPDEEIEENINWLKND